ncbi:uncharacterized protein TNCT_629011 [Trichonephila clavata]|uniref:Uncharacterized protein n=1 Tax=Trichonephila clavata TaxID=2740835 RepID=A0A8X6KUB1_TRICU|nr:uncharacterized protein TNCT_629011 [Trichonephila clavata]
MAPRKPSELTVLSRRKSRLLGQITQIKNCLENVDSPLNQAGLKHKLASLSEIKGKIDTLRNESYSVLSDEELPNFESSLDKMEKDADNLESSSGVIHDRSVPTSLKPYTPTTVCLYNEVRERSVLLSTARVKVQSAAGVWVLMTAILNSGSQQSLCSFQTANVLGLKKQDFCATIAEAIGIKEESSSNPNDQAMQHFKSSVRFNSGRYEVGFPWKRDKQELNDNFSVAENRAKSLAKRFIRDPTLFKQYFEILKEYESQGIIERVFQTEKPTDRAVFYLPHQAAFRQETITTKIRIVFDASSHEDGQL